MRFFRSASALGCGLAALLGAGPARALPDTRAFCDGEIIAGSAPAPAPGGGTTSEIDYSKPGIPSPATLRAQATEGVGPTLPTMHYVSPIFAGFTLSDSSFGCGSAASTATGPVEIRLTDPSGQSSTTQVRVSLAISGRYSMDVGPDSNPDQVVATSGELFVDDVSQGVPVLATVRPAGFTPFGWTPTVTDMSTADQLLYEVVGSYDVVLNLDVGRVYSLRYSFSAQAGIFGDTPSPVTSALEADLRDTVELFVTPLDPTITLSYLPEPAASPWIAAAALASAARRRRRR